MDNGRPDVRLFLPLLLVPLLVLWRIHRRRKAKREKAAARAMARRLAEQRKQAGGKKGKGDKKEKSKSGGLSAWKGSAYRKRLLRFLLMVGLERLIAMRRAQMEESLPSNSMLKKLSTVKDI